MRSARRPSLNRGQSEVDSLPPTAIQTEQQQRSESSRILNFSERFALISRHSSPPSPPARGGWIRTDLNRKAVFVYDSSQLLLPHRFNQTLGESFILSLLICELRPRGCEIMTIGLERKKPGTEEGSWVLFIPRCVCALRPAPVNRQGVSS